MFPNGNHGKKKRSGMSLVSRQPPPPFPRAPNPHPPSPLVFFCLFFRAEAANGERALPVLRLPVRRGQAGDAGGHGDGTGLGSLGSPNFANEKMGSPWFWGVSLTGVPPHLLHE